MLGCGIIKAMTRDEGRAFLLEGTRTGKVATVRADGRPHVAPIWFILDGDELVFMTGRDSVKGKNLRRDPRVMLSVDDERPPFAFVLIEGEAVVSEPAPADLLPWATRIAAHYMGAELGGAYGQRNATKGALLVSLPLTKVLAQATLPE